MKFSNFLVSKFNHAACECVHFLQIPNDVHNQAHFSSLLIDLIVCIVCGIYTWKIWRTTVFIDACFPENSTFIVQFKPCMWSWKQLSITIMHKCPNVISYLCCKLCVYLWGHICAFTRNNIFFAIECCYKLPFNETSVSAGILWAMPSSTITYTEDKSLKCVLRTSKHFYDSKLKGFLCIKIPVLFSFIFWPLTMPDT